MGPIERTTAIRAVQNFAFQTFLSPHRRVYFVWRRSTVSRFGVGLHSWRRFRRFRRAYNPFFAIPFLECLVVLTLIPKVLVKTTKKGKFLCHKSNSNKICTFDANVSKGFSIHATFQKVQKLKSWLKAFNSAYLILYAKFPLRKKSPPYPPYQRGAGGL